ncbi:MAG: hypothetical protein A2Y25_07500 [Candidatus Melainabacteria bacterium GWF2_37_15]|nr:MAG: hypothetical protein A2Y25_07500 [Candidatus Melainabacteria bacterium GWF2_37_15]
MQEKYKKDREFLCKLLGVAVKNFRENKAKSISLVSDEADLSKSIWADLEKGKKDPQFTTLWRISEGLGIKMSELFEYMENEIPEGWSLTEN